MFNSLNGAQLPARIRKPPHVHGTTPSPSTKKKTSKKNTSKKTAPLANSARTNQSKSSGNSNSNSNKKKKRGRKKSSNGIINATSVSVAPYILIGNPTLPDGMFVGSLLMPYLLCVEHTNLSFLSLLFLFLTLLFLSSPYFKLSFHVEGTQTATAFI
jgi:hypothetical protein